MQTTALGPDWSRGPSLLEADPVSSRARGPVGYRWQLSRMRPTRVSLPAASGGRFRHLRGKLLGHCETPLACEDSRPGVEPAGHPGPRSPRCAAAGPFRDGPATSPWGSRPRAPVIPWLAMDLRRRAVAGGRGRVGRPHRRLAVDRARARATHGKQVALEVVDRRPVEALSARIIGARTSPSAAFLSERRERAVVHRRCRRCARRGARSCPPIDH